MMNLRLKVTICDEITGNTYPYARYIFRAIEFNMTNFVARDELISTNVACVGSAVKNSQWHN